jgi:hypothetical protein
MTMKMYYFEIFEIFENLFENLSMSFAVDTRVERVN